MSDTAVAFLVAIAIIAFLFAWVPTLSLCNNTCQRLFLRRRQSGVALEQEEERAQSGDHRESA